MTLSIWAPLRGPLSGKTIGKPAVIIFLTGVLLTGCSHWRESYLNSCVEEATQEDIEAKLGAPWRSKTSLLHGETTWIYRYSLTSGDLDPMGMSTVGRGVSAAANSAAAMIGRGDNSLVVDKPRCYHYLLTFHDTKVLKHWVREPCADTEL